MVTEAASGRGRSWQRSTAAILVLMVATFAIVGGIMGFALTYWFSDGDGWVWGAGAFLAVALLVAAYCLVEPVDPSMKGMGVTECSAVTEPRLYRIVEGLASRAGTPMPRVYVMDANFPNAFALGRTPERAMVCATRPLMDMLDDDQLEGVMAHELSHIIHRDTVVNGVARRGAMALSLSAIMLGAIAIVGASLLGGSGKGSSGGGGVFLLILFVILIPVILACLVLALMLPSAGAIMRFGVSRSREFGADESAGRLTGKPAALAEALVTLETLCSADTNPFSDASTANLWIVCPFGRARRKLMSRLMDTHPPTQERVVRLLKLDREINGRSRTPRTRVWPGPSQTFYYFEN